MSEKQQLILVFYVNVSGMDKYDIAEYLKVAAESLRFDDDGTSKYLIPIFEGDSRVECLNPVMVGEDEYAEVKRKLDEIGKFYQQTLSDADSRQEVREKAIEDATSDPKKARELLEKSGIVDKDGNIAEIYNNVK